MSSVWRCVEISGAGQGIEFRFLKNQNSVNRKYIPNSGSGKKEGKKKAILIHELDKEYAIVFNCVSPSLLIEGSLLFQTKLGSNITEGYGQSMHQINPFKSLHSLFTKSYINDT